MSPLKKASIAIIIAILVIIGYLVFTIVDVEDEVYKEDKQSTTQPVAASEAN